MKLLFDENLSFRLVAAIRDFYPDSAHVRNIGLLGAGDPQVWRRPALTIFLWRHKPERTRGQGIASWRGRSSARRRFGNQNIRLAETLTPPGTSAD